MDARVHSGWKLRVNIVDMTWEAGRAKGVASSHSLCLGALGLDDETGLTTFEIVRRR